MSYPDPTYPHDVRRGHSAGAAYGYEYGDGVSAQPLYGPAVDPLDLDLSEHLSQHGRTSRPREERRLEATEAKKHRAGRNLPAAIGIGVLLVVIVLGTLFVYRPAFIAVVALAAGIGVWELVHAVGDGAEEAPTGRRRRLAVVRARPSLVPLLGGCIVMPILAWYGGVESLVLGLLITVAAVLVWRLSVGPTSFHKDMAAATLIAVYVPFLLSFGVLLAHPADGKWRVLCALAMVVLSDTGGYATGVFLGKHRMAPSISPKKSWEGLAGSLIATGVGGAFLVHYALHQPFWHGAVIGVAASAAAVVGDLAESMIKRDLGIKDMSRLLPGHGGLMDRLDSIVFAIPVTYMLLAALG